MSSPVKKGSSTIIWGHRTPFSGVLEHVYQWTLNLNIRGMSNPVIRERRTALSGNVEPCFSQRRAYYQGMSNSVIKGRRAPLSGGVEPCYQEVVEHRYHRAPSPIIRGCRALLSRGRQAPFSGGIKHFYQGASNRFQGASNPTD